jgi:hypothetical protein
MNANTSLERLFPSVYAFLCAGPTAVTTDVGALSTSTHISTSAVADSAYNAVAASYERWRRCITVCRRVIGNDILLLTLLLHSGCLWSPDYAAIHAAQQAIAKARSPAPAASADDSAVPSSSTPPTTTTPRHVSAGTTVKRKGKRGFQSAADVAAHAARAARIHAAAAEAHQRLTDLCPASMWALHVLHFLRIEEIYAVPSARHSCTTKAAAANPREHEDNAPRFPGRRPGASSGSEDEQDDASSAHGSDSGSDISAASGEEANADENSAITLNKPNIIISNSPVKRGGRVRQTVSEAACVPKRRRSYTRADSRGLGRRRVKWEDAVTSVLDPASSPRRQLAASSWLLPKVSLSHRNGKAASQHNLTMALAALRQEQAERGGKQRQQDNVSGAGDAHQRTDTRDAATKDCAVMPHQTTSPTPPPAAAASASTDDVVLPSPRAHATLLRATVSLVTEEEPLVQQVAAALVEDWLELLTPSHPQSSSSSVPARDSDDSLHPDSTIVDKWGDDDTLKLKSRVHSSVPRRSAAPRNAREALPAVAAATPVEVPHSRAPMHHHDGQNEHLASLVYQQQQRESRHYWLSCLMKLVTYLDGMHSALREENAHVAAVMARQGIAPHEADEIFTRSLPAILNCVLIEEVRQTSTTCPRLWMPPPVLLLPFHFLAQDSRIRVWVPSDVTAATASSSSSPQSTPRTQGRFRTYIVDSHGLHLRTSAEPTAMVKGSDGGCNTEGGEGCGSAQLIFGLRAAEPESLMDERSRASVEKLLPRCPTNGVRCCSTSSEAAQAPLRMWGCTQSATAGCPRVELYVARTLVMLPIPAQSASDSTSNLTDPERAATATTPPHRGNTGEGTTTSTSVRQRTASGVRSRFQRATRTPEEAAVRRRHPLLFHTLQPYLRSTEAKKSTTTPSVGRPPTTSATAGGVGGGRGGLRSDPPPLTLLYGLARGEEAAALRHMGFSVRTGTHHGLGRGGGPAGGVTRTDASPEADDGVSASAPQSYSSCISNGGCGGCGSKGSAGRRTFARDALGTTLEGLYLIARRVMSLKGLYTAARSSAADGRSCDSDKDEGAQHSKHEGWASATSASSVRAVHSGSGDGAAPHYHGKGVVAGVSSGARFHNCDGNAHSSVDAGVHGARSVTTIISAEQEGEILCTTAATLALMTLLLTHQLVDELLEQPFTVLWNTEVASYVVDVSLFLQRPSPRLMKADGFALALLLQPVQSLLLMVGLVGTLVSREVMHGESTPAASQSALAHAEHSSHSGGDDGVGRGLLWHPWWTAFRSAVLRDTTLPSCLHSGVWVLVTKADETVAVAAARTRWQTHNRHLSGGGSRRRRRTDRNTEGDGDSDGGGGWGGRKRLLRLAITATSSTMAE